MLTSGSIHGKQQHERTRVLGDKRLKRMRTNPDCNIEVSIINSHQATTAPRMPRGLLKGLRYGTLFLLASAISISSQAAGNAPIRFAMTDSPPLATAAPEAASGMKGLYPDILDEILTKRMGLQWTGAFVPWKRVQLEVQTGSADVFITVPSDERKAYAIPSTRPVFEEFLHVYTYKDHPKIREIRKIKTADDIQRLGLIPVSNIGNHWHQENIDAHGIETRHVPSEEILARFLAAKRADIMIETPLTMDPKIDSLGLTQQIEKTPARFGPISFHLLVGKKSPLSASMNALDQAIEQFIRDGTRERLEAEHLGSDAKPRD